MCSMNSSLTINTKTQALQTANTARLFRDDDDDYDDDDDDDDDDESISLKSSAWSQMR